MAYGIKSYALRTVTVVYVGQEHLVDLQSARLHALKESFCTRISTGSRADAYLIPQRRMDAIESHVMLRKVPEQRIEII